MTYILLIIVCLLMLLFTYLKNRKDLLSPSILSIIFYTMAIFLAFIGCFSWNTEKQLSIKTIVIIVVGIVSFIIGEVVQKKISGKINKITNKEETKIQKKEKKTIDISWKKVIIVSLFIILTMILMIIQIKKVCNSLGYDSNNIFKLLSYYRHKGTLFGNSITNKNDINFIVKQMSKICVVIGIIFSYVYARQYYYSEKFKKINILLIPIVLSMFETLLTSGRALFMKIAVAFLFMIVFYYYKKKKQKIEFKDIIKILIVLLILIVIFYTILPLVGRKTSANFIEYITFYLGCGIPSLNVFINNLPIHSTWIGEETFQGIYVLLNKFDIIDFTRNTAYGWSYFSGLGSNIYTSFRAYYFDFGWFGLIICQFIFGYISSLFYSYVKKNDYGIQVPIYAYYVCMYIEQIRAEQFFGLISSTTISYLIYFLLVYMIVIDKNLIKKLKLKLKKDKTNGDINEKNNN